MVDSLERVKIDARQVVDAVVERNMLVAAYSVKVVIVENRVDMKPHSQDAVGASVS